MNGLTQLGSAIASYFTTSPKPVDSANRTDPKTRQARIDKAQSGSDNVPKYPQGNAARTTQQNTLAGN